MNCPICDTAGLPDYTKEIIKCPQCNSDLSGFKLIADSKRNVRDRLLKQGGFILLILIILYVPIVLFIRKGHFERESINLEVIAEKKDSIDILRHEIDKLQLQVPKQKITKVKFEYVVKPDDNLSTIAEFFYDNWTMYRTIMTDNNLTNGDLIYPHDTLFIYLNH